MIFQGVICLEEKNEYYEARRKGSLKIREKTEKVLNVTVETLNDHLAVDWSDCSGGKTKERATA